MRELKYYVACTVDRFIAREDGSFDFFPMEGEHFADLLESFPETVPAHLRDALGVRAGNKRFDVVARVAPNHPPQLSKVVSTL
jgi:hypothetical protein